MTNIPLTKLPTETLRDKSRALTREELLSDEIQTLIDDMIETMQHAKGVGLAA